MSIEEKSPHKHVQWLLWLIIIFDVAWVINLNEFVTIVGSILTFATGMLSFFKPDIFPEEKLLPSDKRTINFSLWSSRTFGIAFLIISVIMMISYRHNTVLYVYMAALAVLVMMSIRQAIWIIFCSSGQRRIETASAWISFLVAFITLDFRIFKRL